jgi:hypothetical protein
MCNTWQLCGKKITKKIKQKFNSPRGQFMDAPSQICCLYKCFDLVQMKFDHKNDMQKDFKMCWIFYRSKSFISGRFQSLWRIIIVVIVSITFYQFFFVCTFVIFSGTLMKTKNKKIGQFSKNCHFQAFLPKKLLVHWKTFPSQIIL